MNWGIGRRPLRRASIAGVLALLMAFYFWTAMSSDVPSRPTENATGSYYGLLANAFRAGQLHLLIDPSPQLLALPDPYDPIQNAAFRLHDAVLFRGKYYLYYGPTPALLLYLPFKALTGLELTDPLVVALSCSVGLFFAFRLVEFLRHRYMPQTPFGLRLATLLALGFGSVMPFLLRRPLHYEVAISAGNALAFAALYYFVAGSLDGRLHRGRIAVGSLLLGLAAGARVPMLAAGLVPAVLAGYVVLNRKREPLLDQLTTLLAFGAPVTACVFLLGLYNHLRFGSWTEFGIGYTLQAWQSARTYKFFSLARLPPGMFYYGLAPPRLGVDFPFIRLDAAFYLPPPPGYYLEPVAGILPGVPLVAILFLAPLLYLGSHPPPLALWLTAGPLLATGLVLLVQAALAAGTMRYEVDFAIFLLVPALLLWFACANALRYASAGRMLTVTIFAGLLCVTVIVQTAFSLVGYYDNLKRGSPRTYEAIHSVFLPLERRLHAP
jgi:hypothetical protein